MKSFINSEELKKVILQKVEEALNACAEQHNSNIEMYSEKHLALLNEPIQMLEQPSKLEVTLEFYFNKFDNIKPIKLFCQPTIDLSTIKVNK